MDKLLKDLKDWQDRTESHFTEQTEWRLVIDINRGRPFQLEFLSLVNNQWVAPVFTSFKTLSQLQNFLETDNE